MAFDSQQQQHPQESVSFDTPFFKGKASGNNVNLILTFFTFVIVLAAVVFGAPWVWSHLNAAEAKNITMIEVLKEHNSGQAKMTSAMKENTCLLSLPQEKREMEFMSPNSLCKRLSQ